MSKHSGKREIVARKSRKGKSNFAMQDAFGVITLKLGRKKFSEIFFRNRNSLLLKKRFRGCVVDAER